MDFEFSQEIEKARENARKFAMENITSELARKYDAEEKFPEEIWNYFSATIGFLFQ